MPLSLVPDTEIVAAVMQDVLDGINTTFEQANVDLPTRQLLTVGGSVHDCEQVTVNFEQLYVGGPGDQSETPQPCEAPRSVVLTIQIVRCIPVPASRGVAPTPAQMTESTQRLMTDSWLILKGAMVSESAAYLGAIADVAVTPPEGQYQAVVLNLVVGVP